jgi:predicted Zn-ribbon and HTH transcriptional regulator
MSAPCQRPECGGEVHTDGWGTPIRCPQQTSVWTISDPGQTFQLFEPSRNIVILGEDGRTPLVTIHPDGTLEYGPGYTPDEAASRFWDALRRIAPARCPACGHIGLEAP